MARKKSEPTANPAENPAGLSPSVTELPTAESVSAGTLAMPLLASMPEVTKNPGAEIILDAETIETPTNPLPDSKPVYSDSEKKKREPSKVVRPEFKGTKDKEGTVFDSAKHAVDADGKPKLTATGKFRAIDKRSTVVNPRKSADGKNIPPPAAPYDPKCPDDFDRTAAFYLDTGTGIASAAISKEWQFENEGERESMRAPLAAYLRAKGTIDLTPGQMFLVMLGCFAFKRIQMPETSKKLNKLLGVEEKEEKKPGEKPGGENSPAPVVAIATEHTVAPMEDRAGVPGAKL